MWIYTTAAASPRRIKLLTKHGAHIVVAPTSKARPRLSWVLEHLGKNQVARLLVEGGGEVAASFLQGNCVQRVSWHLAPLLMGADALPAVGSLSLRNMADVGRIKFETVRRSGTDVILEGEPVARVHGVS